MPVRVHRNARAGTAGRRVVASTVLKQSKGDNGGWVVITIAWGLAVMCGVLVAGPYSGAHLNPALSIGLAAAGSFPWASVPGYVAAQLLGGFCGAVLVYIYYKDHPAGTPPWRTSGRTAPSLLLMGRPGPCWCWCSWPWPTKRTRPNQGREGGRERGGGWVRGRGVWRGERTGYAINPARDLPPRIAHSILPIRAKGPSGWGYSWVPVAGPVLERARGGAGLRMRLYLRLNGDATR